MRMSPRLVSTLIKLALMAAMVFFSLGFHRSYEIYERTGAVDFRNRVVAARIADAGINPYHFKWDPSFPLEFYDPSDENDMVFTRMTSPPTTLFVHQLYSSRPWTEQKATNFFLGWTLLIGIAGVIVFTQKKISAFASSLSALVLGIFALSGAWQFHAERGQQYIYGAFFLTLAACFGGNGLRSNGASGFFATLAAYFRPTLGLSAFFYFRKDRGFRYLAAMAIASVVLILPVFLKIPLAWWKDYFSGSRDWYLHVHNLQARLDPALVKTFPMIVSADGDPHLAHYENFGVWGNVFYHFLLKLFKWVPSYNTGMIALVLLVLASGWMLWKARGEASLAFGLRFFSMIYLTDMILPAPRSGYNVVLFFPALLMAAISVVNPDVSKSEKWKLLPLFAGMLASLNSMWSPLSSPLIVETLFMIGAIMILFRRTESKKPIPAY